MDHKSKAIEHEYSDSYLPAGSDRGSHYAMGIVEFFGLAGSISLLSGWPLYLAVFVTGLAMRLEWISLPENLQVLDAIANRWVMGISAAGALAEFFAGKILWLDSIWDTLHTFIRPLGGALLALAIVDSDDPVWQVIAFPVYWSLKAVPETRKHGITIGSQTLCQFLKWK